MANEGKTTLQLSVKTALYDPHDLIVIMYGADTANYANTNVAQTATIPVTNFANSFANSLQIMVQQPDPDNSFALSIGQGQVFASNAYLYVAVANNVTQRAALFSF